MLENNVDKKRGVDLEIKVRIKAKRVRRDVCNNIGRLGSLRIRRSSRVSYIVSELEERVHSRVAP